MCLMLHSALKFRQNIYICVLRQMYLDNKVTSVADPAAG